MILTSIRARRFRGIKRETSKTFDPGLNIIKGSDNEAGKSSLRMAITKCLFQDPTSVSDDTLKLTRWGEEQLWEVELEFQVGTTSYQLRKSLEDKTCKLARIDALEHSITSKKAVADKIAELIGCPSEVFFESTACIAQDEMIRLIPSGAAPAERKSAFGTLTQRLQATLSGAQETDVSNIISRLYNKAHRREAKGPHWQLQRITERLNVLLRDKPAQEAKVGDLMAKRKELNQIKKDLEQINKDLPTKQELLEKNNRIFELQDAVSRDTNQYESFERAKKFKDKLDSIDRRLEEFAHFSGKDAELQQLDDFGKELQDLEKRKAGIQRELGAAEKQKPALWKLILGVLGTILFLGGLVSGFIANKYIYLALGTLGGLLLFGYWLISQMLWHRQITSLSRELKNLGRQMYNQLDLVKPILSSMGFKDFNEYISERNRYAGKQAERKEPYNKLSGILGDKDWEQFKSENSGLAIKVTASQEELKSLLPFKLDPLQLQKLGTAVNGQGGLTQQTKILEGKKLGLDSFFAYTDVDTDQLASMEEEIKWLQNELAFYSKKQRIYDIACQVLDNAHKQTLSRAATVLEKELSKYISTITDGRYKQVRINEQNLSIQTFSPEKNDWVNVAELSRATQDQFYICARFALVNLITEGKRPPLLLDDPFVNFHQKRLERTIPLLQELAKENQILLFTCSDAYDDYGHVISAD